MGLTIGESVPILTVFLQGLLSFFSPCVLPLLPVYIGWLSGGTVEKDAEGAARYDRGKVLLHTLCFVAGIAFAFFLLGLGLRAAGRFFSGNRLLFARIGGVIVVLFGLYQLGAFGTIPLLNREKKINVRFERMAMSPWTALVMGFVFSFAWTPCVGPTLSSVLLMASSAASAAAGFALIGVYTLGFVLPFLLTGMFTTTLLNLFRKHRGVLRYSVRIGGVLLILMGLLMITGRMNSLTGYLSRSTAQTPQEEEPAAPEEEASAQTNTLAAPDFTLTDQYGNEHTLSDYRGKIVFLNFWATWCPPCRQEMPDIQALYEDYEADPEADVVILGVAFPGHGGEEDVQGITDFLADHGYTYPVLMDTEEDLASRYYITAYPTTFMIDREGQVFGYVTGSMSRDIMESIIRQTREGVRDAQQEGD